MKTRYIITGKISIDKNKRSSIYNESLNEGLPEIGSIIEIKSFKIDNRDIRRECKIKRKVIDIIRGPDYHRIITEI